MATPSVAGLVAYFLNIFGRGTTPEQMRDYIVQFSNKNQLTGIRKQILAAGALPNLSDLPNSFGYRQSFGVQQLPAIEIERHTPFHPFYNLTRKYPRAHILSLEYHTLLIAPS
jgi:hypothetical protein